MSNPTSRTLAGYSCDTETIRNEVREILLLMTKYG